MADESAPAGTPKPRTIRPRNVSRKSKAEREAYEKQEDQRRAARSAAAAGADVSTKPAAGSSKQKDRKTTEDKPRDGQQKSATGSGVFSAGTRGKPSSLRRLQDAGQSEMLEGQEGVKPEDGVGIAASGGGSSRTVDVNNTSVRGGAFGTVKDEFEETAYIIDREIDNGPKRNIDHIYISSDEDHADSGPQLEEPIISSKRKAKTRMASSSRSGLALRPVRAPRTNVTQDDGEEAAFKRPRKQTLPNRMTQQDREEPDVDFDEMEIDEEQGQHDHFHVKQDMPSSPELGRRKLGKRSQTRSKDPRAAVETVEERAERFRLYEDIRKMREEFLVLPKTDDAKEMATVNTHSGELKDERLFLFQFPPLTPYLVDTQSPQAPKSPVVAIKRDPDTVSGAMPTQHEDPTPAGSAAMPTLQNEGIFTATEPMRIPAGRVGKLSIHKSGKISLDWGGIDMELRHGAEVDFLQDAVLVESTEQPPPDEDGGHEKPSAPGRVYGLGQIHRKFVAIPDWQKLYD